MALNAFFDQGGGLDSTGFSLEQQLIENLYTEAIKIYGFDVFYIPRTLVNVDKIFNEDELSKFTSAHSIEMYLQSVDGFEVRVISYLSLVSRYETEQVLL